MIFTETRLAGAFVIDMERLSDERGFFARSWCEDEFAAHGIHMSSLQANVSSNPKRGTLRGMHYQNAPHGESKLGALYPWSHLRRNYRSARRVADVWDSG
jgi:dTDP-4-dehydrorhamnose 3,5-epimerase